MARPKKNVEIKEEKKELKRKGRPRKVVENKPTLEERVAQLEDIVGKLGTRVIDIHEDLNTLSNDVYGAETTENEWEDLLDLIDKKNKANKTKTTKTEVRINGKRINTDDELDAAIDELVDVLSNVFGR